MNDLIKAPPKRITPRGETGKLIKRAMRVIPGVAGKRYRLAKLLGTNAANVAAWLKGTRVDARYCVAIDEFSGGEVRRDQLRPDVFPAPGKVLPLHPRANDGKRYARTARKGDA